MNDQEQKHWFKLGREYEKSNKSLIQTLEFWIGLWMGFIVGNLIMSIVTL